MGRDPDSFRIARRHPHAGERECKALQADRAAVGILLHLLALQHRLLPQRSRDTTPLQHWCAAVLLPDGPANVRPRDEVPRTPARAFPGKVFEPETLSESRRSAEI